MSKLVEFEVSAPGYEKVFINPESVVAIKEYQGNYKHAGGPEESCTIYLQSTAFTVSCSHQAARRKLGFSNHRSSSDV